jgi:uncharacterized membrane protein
MSTILRKLHLFLREHSFYILVFSSILACSFFAWRFFYSGSTNYLNLISNLFLAWVPYGLSLLAAVIKRVRPTLWPVQLLLGFTWLVFFPNAPYLLTDFYHLGWRPPVPLWYDIGLIIVFAFTGCFLAIASLRAMHTLVEQSLGKLLGWLFSLIALVMAGMGVYLGRIERWNSWDLVVHPRAFFAEFAQQVLNPLENLGFLGFTLMFTSIMVAFYLFVSSGQKKSG